MYVIVSKCVKTIENAKRVFSEMIGFLKQKGVTPLLCQNEVGFFIARELKNEDGYILNSKWVTLHSKEPSTRDTLNIIEEL